MRLSKRLQKIIKSSLIECFGQVDVYLFGSRTDDNKKGGDIDIAVTSELSKEEFRSKKIKFILSLLRKGIDLKIDLVQYNRVNQLLLHEINASKVELK